MRRMHIVNPQWLHPNFLSIPALQPSLISSSFHTCRACHLPCHICWLLSPTFTSVSLLYNTSRNMFLQHVVTHPPTSTSRLLNILTSRKCQIPASPAMCPGSILQPLHQYILLWLKRLKMDPDCPVWDTSTLHFQKCQIWMSLIKLRNRQKLGDQDCWIGEYTTSFIESWP